MELAGLEDVPTAQEPCQGKVHWANFKDPGCVFTATTDLCRPDISGHVLIRTISYRFLYRRVLDRGKQFS